MNETLLEENSTNVEKIQQIVYYVFRFSNAIVGIVGNTFTLIIISKLKVKLNGHIAMAYLAISDIMVSCTVPLATVVTFTGLSNGYHSYWVDLCVSKEYFTLVGMNACGIAYLTLALDRLILVSTPLHYKHIVTRTRLHTFVITAWMLLGNIPVAIAMIFLRNNDLNQDDQCVLKKVLSPIGFYAIPLFLFLLSTILLLLAYVTILVKLYKQKIISRYLSHGLSNRALDVNSKITRACVFTLTIYIILYTPAIAASVISTFISGGLSRIALDITFLFYFLNNSINPFIYYRLLRDFKKGYKNLLCCKMPKLEPVDYRSTTVGGSDGDLTRNTYSTRTTSEV